MRLTPDSKNGTSKVSLNFEDFVLKTAEETLVTILGERQAGMLISQLDVLSCSIEIVDNEDRLKVLHGVLESLFGPFSFALVEALVWTLSARIGGDNNLDKKDFFSSLEKLRNLYESGNERLK